MTLDELRPLLDNIGGEGVHIEMDFHNETEVEQAMEIVAQYQTAPSMPLPFGKNKMVQQAESRNSLMVQQAEQRILVLDGGMGTMLQQYGLQENDFRGKRFAAHPCSLAGCNDVLSLTQPQVVKKVHRRYMEAGADIIETNTFNAQRVSMADFGLQENIREINLEACRIAREVADEFSRKNPNKPRFVVGSIGPTNKTCSFSTDGKSTLGKEVLRQAYQEQIEALVDGGVDALLIETIFDTMNAEMAIEAAENVFAEKKRRFR